MANKVFHITFIAIIIIPTYLGRYITRDYLSIYILQIHLIFSLLKKKTIIF